MKKAYTKYRFQSEEEDRYTLMARLSLLGFDSFEETDEGLEAYWLVSKTTSNLDAELKELAQSLSFTYTTEETLDQNWNALWEASFQPIQVGRFCGVRADFHPPMTDVRHEIIINPKMAFGTGHHATTYMMLAALEELPMSGKKVLDYGCGTGILAILAARLGSAPIDAVDIEEEACENTRENCRANGVTGMNVVHGTLAQIPDREYDIILANINRNVILDSLPSLYEKLLPNGLLLVSGILENDRDIVCTAAREQPFQVLKIQERTGWLSILFKKA